MFKNIATMFLFALFMTPVMAQPAIAPAKAPVQNQQVTMKVTPLQIVENPSKYLNKKVSMTAKFDKFATLGLDYKKAFRDSSKYITFLVQREDVTEHNIPLSELKLFLKRDYAEKFIDLNTGDKIKMSGFVFSNALGDAWIDINTIEILEKTPSDKTEK